MSLHANQSSVIAFSFLGLVLFRVTVVLVQIIVLVLSIVKYNRKEACYFLSVTEHSSFGAPDVIGLCQALVDCGA